MAVENSNGFGVVSGELTGYAQHTRRMATELHELATRRIGSVNQLAEHGLGPIGRESGFVAALNHFAAALGHQVAGVAKNADALGDSVAKAGHTYREQDEAQAKEFLDMITGRKS